MSARPMSALVSIQQISPGVFQVSFRKNKRKTRWLFATWREAITAAAGIMGVRE